MKSPISNFKIMIDIISNAAKCNQFSQKEQNFVGGCQKHCIQSHNANAERQNGREIRVYSMGSDCGGQCDLQGTEEAENNWQRRRWKELVAKNSFSSKIFKIIRENNKLKREIIILFYLIFKKIINRRTFFVIE